MYRLVVYTEDVSSLPRLAEGVRSGPAGRGVDAHAEILAATRKLLEHSPSVTLTVEAILTEAGVSRGTFYHYFASKHEVVGTLARTAMNEVMGQVRPFLDPANSTPGAAVLDASLAAGWSAWAQHRPALRAVMGHWGTVPLIRELWLTVIDEFTTAIAGEIDRQRAAGLAPPGPPSRPLVATLLWSTAQCAYLVDLGVDDDLADEDLTLGAVIAMWTGALYGNAAGDRG